ncbi:hypothetical protein AK830_g7360 [Neonectria ditissima]|uniref:Ornithine aminotransferase n=1 Tax=Neonectria ditissima TaxID=78410 RepID=A0A0N8H6K3_9HYPO|nr:hypothetical protein AK830_g7360 [Neonectria ditissima]
MPPHATTNYRASSTKTAIAAETQFAAHNYTPLPVVFARAQGVNVWDPEGRHYLDFLSAYSAVNQGHCHPELVKALVEQAGRLTLSSRAFYNDVFPRWAEKVHRVFGYDMVLPMNTGAEAVETAIKLARKWAYKVKGVEKDRAVIFSVADNFHGRTVQALCKKHKVLFICDEIQTGIGRTGRMLCSHGSTYGGNPLGCAVSIRALEIMEEEDLTAKAERLGQIFREGIRALDSPIIKTVREKGLLNATVIDASEANGRTAWDLCLLLKSKGL